MRTEPTDSETTPYAEVGSRLPRRRVSSGVAYRDQSLTLEPGDALVLFTDGVTEAEGGEGTELGSEKVCAAIQCQHGLAAAEIAECVEKTVQQHVGDRTLGDDVTLMVVSRNRAN